MKKNVINSKYFASLALSLLMGITYVPNVFANQQIANEKALSAVEPTTKTVGWGDYTLNKPPLGDVIRLKVDGKVREFNSGVGAHAPAKLVYNINNEYDVFEGYIGIDASREKYGVGEVKYTISTSENNKDWTVKEAIVKKGNENATLVKIDVKGANYLKVEIDNLGSMHCDHSVLADAKLYKEVEEEKPTVTFSVPEGKVDLSTLEPLEARTGVSNMPFAKNKTANGNQIKLFVDGTPTIFPTGIFAHATANVVYDVTNYSDFEGYLGVTDYVDDNNTGDVVFTIYTSNDGGANWTAVKTARVIGNENAVKVNVDLTNANRLRFAIDNNGSQHYDHSVVAGASFTQKVEEKKEFTVLTQAEYDAQIKELQNNFKGSVEDFAEANRKLIYQRELVSRIPTGTLNASKEQAKALMDNETALYYFLEAGEADAGATYTKSFENWCKIYNAHKEDLSNEFNLKLAIAVSHSHSKAVGFWIGPTYPQQNSAVERYESYKYIVEKGIMDSLGSGPSTNHFKNLPVAMMKYAVNARISEDEVIWLARFIQAKKSMDPYQFMKYGKSNPGWNNGYTAQFLYNGTNKNYYVNKYLLNAEGSRFKYGLKSGGQFVRRQFAVFEQGGICGAFGYAYAAMYNVMGLPGEGMIQPMHNGALVENGSGIWELKNNLHGWEKTAVRQDIVHLGGNRIMPLTWGAQSWQTVDSASYVILTQAALDDYTNFRKATTLMFLGDIYGKQSDRAKEAFKAALNAQPKNPDAACKVAYSSTTAQERKALVDRVTQADSLLYYPLPLKDVITFVNRSASQTEKVAYQSALNNALNKAASATESNVRQSDVCRTMAGSLLGTLKTEPLASLGTDDKGNPKIVIADTYSKVPGLAWEYSINGAPWVAGDPAKRETVLDKATVTGDIRIRIVGSGDSSILTLKYTPVNLNRVLIPLASVKAHSTSTTERNYSAASALDGNINTGWMSFSNLLNKSRKDYIIVKFDKVRNLTAVEYASNIKNGEYGRLKVANIQVSVDGKTWTNAGNSGNLPNNANISNIPLNKVYKAQYVKIQAVSNYNDLRGGMHASILKFYEDRTAQ